MDRFKRFRAYARAWATGEIPDGTHDNDIVAAAIGARAKLAESKLMTIQELDVTVDSLGIDAEEEPGDDEPDVGPSARDKREREDAQARLRQLIAAGGATDAGGRWLFDAAADEILRLRADVGNQQAHVETLRGIASGREGELRQAKEALEQARAKVDELRAKAPAVAHEQPGKAAGAEAATAGTSSLTEEHGAAQDLACECPPGAPAQDRCDRAWTRCNARLRALRPELEPQGPSPKRDASPVVREYMKICDGAIERLGAEHAEGLWPAASRVKRERDEARAEAAALREQIARAAPYDGPSIMPGSDIKIDPATWPGDPAEEPSGMRIEKREDGEWLVGSPEILSDCGEVRDERPCHYHLSGQHISTSISRTDKDGAEFIVARWPIAAPAREDEPSDLEKVAAMQADLSAGLRDGIARMLKDGEVMTSADERVTLIVRGGVDADDVFKACAELLDMPSESAELVRVAGLASDLSFASGVEEGKRQRQEYGLAAIGDLAKMQERDAAWTRITGAVDPEQARDALLSTGRGAIERAHAEGVTEGERRAKVKAVELATSWENDRVKSLRLMRDQSESGQQFMLGGINSMSLHALQIRKAFGIAPADPGKPPTGEPVPSMDDAFDGFPADVPPEVDEQAAEIAAIVDERVSKILTQRRDRITSELGTVIASATAENLAPHEIAYRVVRRLEVARGFAPIVPGKPSAEERAVFAAGAAGPFIPHAEVMAGVCERAHADGIVEGLTCAYYLIKRSCDLSVGQLDAIDECLEREIAKAAANVVPSDGQPTPVAPDRETLGRAVHAELEASICEHEDYEPCSWEEQDDETEREPQRRIGERLFAMGARQGRLSMKAERDAARHERDAARRETETLQRELDTSRLEAANWVSRFRLADQRAHAEMTRAQNVEARLAEVTFPRLFPVTPGPLAELAERIEGVMVRAFSEPGDGERRGPAAARWILRLVDEHLHGAARTTEAPAQGPTLEALRELAVSFRRNEAMAAARVDKHPDGTRGEPFHDGRRIAFAYCVKALCRVAGIEPPPCPPSPSVGPQGTPGPGAQDGSAGDHEASLQQAIDCWNLVASEGKRVAAMTQDRAVAPPSAPWGSALEREGRAHAAYSDPAAQRDGAILLQASRFVRSEADARIVLSALGFAPGAADRVLSGETAPEDPAAVTPPRFEVMDGALVTVGSQMSDCGEHGPVHGVICTAHIDGQHVTERGRAGNGLGSWHVLERWPIAPASPETPDPRWEPGATWEHHGQRRTLMESQRQHDPPRAYFRELGWLEGHRRADMTEVNGWRYVGKK